MVAALMNAEGVQAQSPPEPEATVLRECLVIENAVQPRRAPVHVDPIEAQIVAGTWMPPRVGDASPATTTQPKMWEKIVGKEDGWFEHAALGNGYAYFAVNAPEERIVLLEAVGHSMVYVNGEPRAGDPYQYGFVRLPIKLRRGTNDLLFLCGRGRLRAKLIPSRAPVMLDCSDATLPDLGTGEDSGTSAAVLLVNATDDRLEGLTLRARLSIWTPVESQLAMNPENQATKQSQEYSADSPLPLIAPLTVRKVGFKINGARAYGQDNAKIELELRRPGATAETLDRASIALRVRGPEQSRRITFTSDIDGSLQYYAALPPAAQEAGRDPALVLTLHGAGVEATGQVDSYAPKPWAWIVAPTNRRPFGFDWEDWGRDDALEVLGDAQSRFLTDPSRVYLTGHSMGGHGVWSLGALFPERFAAIGPSAGWISFWSYGGMERQPPDDPVMQLLERAAAASDTLALVRNYQYEGVYILHGDADDNVPVEQARAMRERLAEFHHDFEYHEQPGAGHWWDASDEPGVDCVDWAPMFDFFARHRKPSAAELRHVDFTTVNPSISARCQWLTIAAQHAQLRPSRADIRWDPGRRRFVGATENVARLALHLTFVLPGEPLTLELDGGKIETQWTGERTLWLEHELQSASPAWTISRPLDGRLKGPDRYGPFKQVFGERMIFVYGTRGTPEENAWAYAKARYDAETFWYRGNGSVEVIPDTQVSGKLVERSMILYGNATSNAAWKQLLSNSPVAVERGRIRLEARELAGDDLACLFIQPSPFGNRALVGVVGGTGIKGMRLTERLPYFVSGVAYPDCIVLGPEVLTDGSPGVRAAGFFGLDWSVESGEFAWRDQQEHPPE
ncbi:MAG TPA: prolyl oligopeptidase family serine peptidase [Phycisphaerae bacterium]